MISHRNVIANILQYCIYEDVARKKQGVETQVELGLLPFSHIYGLQVIAHSGTWRGDEIIVLPKFELTQFLHAIETFKINHLLVVRALRRLLLAGLIQRTNTQRLLGASYLRAFAERQGYLQEV
jgi:acyl-CoA synthetase (AMP-forming)/AMP-acid ligase II